MNKQLVPDATARPHLIEPAKRGLRSYPIFGGWGPKMMAFAIGATAIAASSGRSDAQTISTHRSLCILGMAPPILAPAQAHGWPNNLSESDAVGTVNVRVSVDTSAHVTATAIDKTSGDFALDQEARRLLSEAKFTSSDAACATKPGDYAFVVEYLAPGQ